MTNMNERSINLRCDVGLHVLRYARARDLLFPPTIYLCPPPSLEIIAPPNSPSDRLDAPGAAVVVRAKSVTNLPMIVRAREPSESCSADVRIKPIFGAYAQSWPPLNAPMGIQQLAQSASSAVPVSTVVSAPTAPLPPVREGVPEIEMLAHVARRGDVVVNAGEWAGGPEAPAQIEGLELRASGLPVGSIEYQVCMAGTWTDWVQNGTFAGTRARATPLTGLRLRMSEHALPGFALNLEAIFLGSAIVRRRARQFDLSSASSVDPLVGLRLSIERVDTEVQPNPNARTTSNPGKVRVFRAGADAHAP